MVLIVASWAAVAGVAEIAVGVPGRASPPRTRALFFLGGLASVAFGVALFAHPGMGAVALALLYAACSNLIYGTLGARAGHRAASGPRRTLR